MQVLLLATGETSRLQPLTAGIPSPMLPVANRPLMARAVELLVRHDFRHFVVSLYHGPGLIEQYFRDGRRWGVEIEYSLQRDAWGTAGAIKWAEPLLNGPFVVMPADAIAEVDLTAVVAQHRAQGSDLTAVVHPCPGGQPLYLDHNNQALLGHDGEEMGTRFSETGIYVLEPGLLSLIPRRTEVGIYQHLLPELLQAGYRAHGYQMDGYWNPLSNFDQYQRAQHDYLYASWNGDGDRECPHYPDLRGTEIGPGIWVENNHLIHPTARLTPPVYIGQNCQIGRDVELGPEVVIGNDVIVDDEATIHHSIILPNTYVGQLVNVAQRIVHKQLMVDPQSGESSKVVDEFLLSEAHPAVVSSDLRRLFSAVVALWLLWFSAPFLLLLSALVWFSSGRLLQRVARHVDCPPPSLSKLSNGASRQLDRTVSLLRFYTRRPNGSFIGFGRWLERWQLHRLPELWNVVRGDIELVGLHPLSPERAGAMNETWKETRQGQPAGFTGLWYVQMGDDSELDELLVTDAYYAATRSWQEDLSLLLQTPRAWRRQVAQGDGPVEKRNPSSI